MKCDHCKADINPDYYIRILYQTQNKTVYPYGPKVEVFSFCLSGCAEQFLNKRIGFGVEAIASTEGR